jgi:hypothetical protein
MNRTFVLVNYLKVNSLYHVIQKNIYHFNMEKINGAHHLSTVILTWKHSMILKHGLIKNGHMC